MSKEELNKHLRRGEKYGALKALADNIEVMGWFDYMIEGYEKQALILKSTDEARFKALVGRDAIQKLKKMVTNAEHLNKMNEDKIDKIQNPSKESI